MAKPGLVWFFLHPNLSLVLFRWVLGGCLVSSPGNKANLAKLELGARLCFAICNFIFYGQYKNCETHCRGEKFTIFLQVITGPNMVLTWS